MKKVFVLIIVYSFFGFLSACSQETNQQEAQYDTLPLMIDDKAIKPLRELVDETLEARLIAQLNKNRQYKRLMEQKKMAVGLVDLRDPLHVKRPSQHLYHQDCHQLPRPNRRCSKFP